MKALTIKQPWASLIVNGIKDVENRGWKTSYRGIIAIHAGLRIDQDGMEHAHLIDDMPTGVLIGSARIVDCISDSESEWAVSGLWHWVLADAKPCAPRLAKGKLSLWELTSSEESWVKLT